LLEVTTPITNPNILWGAAAAVGMTLAEWQRQREEEARRAEQSQGTSKGARKKYEEMMRKKRIVGESQALLNQKYANEKAQKKAQESTHNHLLNEHRDVAVSTPIENNTFSNLWNSYITPLSNSLSNQWNEFTNNITTPSNSLGPLLNFPFNR
jgi:hypothetical protein